MQKSMQFRVFLCVAVVVAALFYLIPTYNWYSKPQEERETLEKQKDKMLDKILNLGLDLRGGIHLVLEVDVSKAPEDMKDKEVVNMVKEIIRNRIDQFGVAEPHITKQGERWIVVQLPGVKDPERAIDLIGQKALLEFKLVDNTARMSDFVDENGEFDETKIPEELELLNGKEDSKYLVKKEAELTGSTLKSAKIERNQFNMPHVAIEFNKEGADIFKKVTEANIERNLAIVLDGVVQSAPVIRTRIPDGNAIIEGNFTMDEATNLVIVLRAGTLPAPVKIIENRTVGPSLGRDSIQAGLYACLLGMAVVLVFMLVYYQLAGLIADLALFLNIIILMGAMAMIHATLTLPGIAGIILTVGMAVDANVLIFERIREELSSGKTVRVAIDAGYEKALRTILDANITTLIAAGFLFQFGTGPIKGFAITLFLGIIISMFTSIILTHLVFDLLFTGKVVKKLRI